MNHEERRNANRTFSQRRAAKLLDHIAAERPKAAQGQRAAEERRVWEAQDDIIWHRRGRKPWALG